jgi:hypothetical protein
LAVAILWWVSKNFQISTMQWCKIISQLSILILKHHGL